MTSNHRLLCQISTMRNWLCPVAALGWVLIILACGSRVTVGDAMVALDTGGQKEVSDSIDTTELQYRSDVPVPGTETEECRVLSEVDGGRQAGDIVGCEKHRKPGDLLEPCDCWAPPVHYCAGAIKLTDLPIRACSTDSNHCCLFSASCLPCGWQRCEPVSAVRAEQIDLDEMFPGGKCPADLSSLEWCELTFPELLDLQLLSQTYVCYDKLEHVPDPDVKNGYFLYAEGDDPYAWP